MSSNGEASLRSVGGRDGHTPVNPCGLSAHRTLTSWLESEAPARAGGHRQAARHGQRWRALCSSALLAPQGPPAFCMCVLGLCLKSVLFPGLTSKLPHLRPRGALGLCSGLVVLCCLWLFLLSSWSPACTLPTGPAQGLGNCPAVQAPVAQVFSIFTGLINL